MSLPSKKVGGARPPVPHQMAPMFALFTLIALLAGIVKTATDKAKACN